MNFETNLPLEPNVTPLFERRRILDTRVDLHMASPHLKKSYEQVESERLAAAALRSQGPAIEQVPEKPPTPQELVEREGHILLSLRRRRAMGANAIDHNVDQNMPNAA